MKGKAEADPVLIKMDDIAVVGIGCDFPGGEGLDNFWRVLVEGKNCAVEIPDERFDCSKWYDPDDSKPRKTRTKRAALINGFNEFDHKFFGITDAEADQMDPQHKLLLQCSYRALENAGIPMNKASGSRTGVYIGLMNKDYEIRLSGSSNTITHYFATGSAMSVAANRISYTFNFTGPSFALDCACSSSLVALHSACQGIRQGDCDMALCGGVSCIFEPNIFVALSKAKMISPDGTSKPFSNKADGYGRGEGCGIVILKPLKRAIMDSDHIWGIISKTAVNQDGRTVTPITKPSMTQQEELLSRIYSTESDLTSVQYIEAHGTGTPVGDPIEAGSISKVISKARPPGSGQIYMGSVKGNIGHTESAAGVAGLIKVLLMMKHETIVPSVFYTEDGSSIDAKALNVIVPTQPEKWHAPSTGRAAGINNFGFGGTNAHVIIKQYNQPNKPDRKVKESQHTFVLSAASEKSLTSMIADMAEQLSKDTTGDMQSLAYTSACKRTHVKHKYRKVFRASSLTDLKGQLKACLDRKPIPSKQDLRLVFVFCGNGVTYRGMCSQLLKEEPVFREKMKEIEIIFQQYHDLGIVDALENDTDEKLDFSKPDVVQPLLFAVQVSTFYLLKHWGVRPDAILGHSVGEVAASHCSGLLSLEDAVKVIHYRSVLQNKVTGGKMLVVSNMAVSDVLQYLASFPGKICLAAHNSPTSCTLSGDVEAIMALHQTLSSSANSKTLFLHVLDVPAAYHSHMMDPILSEVESSIGTLKGNYMDTELYSTVSGTIASEHDFCTGSYWSKNIREPVKFEKALTAAAKNKNAVFVEIGPRRALYRNILETLGNDSTVLSTAQPEKDHETLLTTFSKLFELGLNVNWEKFHGDKQFIPTSLPRYQFDSVKKVITLSYAAEAIARDHPVLKQTGKEANEFICDLSAEAVSYLSQHKNNGVSIIPGALYVEMGLAAYMANAKPKAPLNSLQLSINFLSPFLLSKRQPELKVTLEPFEHETIFKIHSSSTVYASGSIERKKGQMVDEKKISLDCLSKRCTSVVKCDELYRKLDMGGFQYGGVFRNKGDIFCGEEFREAYSAITVPDELLSQVHDFCIHPVILDYLLQMTLVTSSQGSVRRPGFPAAIGSLAVIEPLQDEMLIYLRLTDMAADHFEVCGCFTDIEGRVLVEVKHLIVKYVGSVSCIVDEYFFHNDYSVISEDDEGTFQGTALVFSDHNAISVALKPYLVKGSKYISMKYANTLMKQGPAALFAKMNILDVMRKFTDILFLWGNQDLSAQTVDEVLSNMSKTCEIFRQIVLELRKMNFSNSVRVVTCQSSETTVNHISPGFVLTGMTRACATEVSEFTFQLIDIGSVSADDIKALNQVLISYPCSEYPELVVKDGQILLPQIVHTTIPVTVNQEKKDHCSQTKSFTLQTADPFKMTSLSAIPSNEKVGQIPEKNVEVQLGNICVHSSDYYPVSVSDHKFGQTMYWNKHTNQNHRLLALDFSGIVTAVGKGVSKLKVGDHIAACYPLGASSRVVVPEDVCYRTKKLPFLKIVPCVSYYVVVWRILYSALPKLKGDGKLGILSSVPDSGLVKTLTLIANKSGWNAFVSTELSGPLQDLNKFDALVLLPPFDKALFVKACTVAGVKNVVVVCDSKFSSPASQNILREDNDACIQTIVTSSILAKGSVRAVQPRIYKWLKALHLDKKSISLPTMIFQRATTGSIDLMPIDEPESYFSVRTMAVVALNASSGQRVVSDISVLPGEHRLFYKNCVYIVTGGLTGLGFETVKFIAERDGGHIVILSRRSPSSEMQQEIDAVKQQCGAVIISLQCDIAVTEQVKRAILNINVVFPSCPIKGIFHSAVVLHDALIGSLDQSLYEKVLKPKVNGALNLHQATKHCKLEYFVCYSSISSFLGNASQTNYAAANSFLDIFCHYRKNLGLAAQSINWGALNLGLLSNKDHLQKFLEAKGMMVMEGPDILQSLEQCLVLNKPQQVICKFNLKTMYHHSLSQNPSLSKRMITLVLSEVKDAEMSGPETAHKELPSSPNEFVRTVLSEALGVDKDEINDEILLSALGVDSMLGMTLQNIIFQERGVNVPLVKLLDPNCTVASLVAILMENTREDHEDNNDNTSL